MSSIARQAPVSGRNGRGHRRLGLDRLRSAPMPMAMPRFDSRRDEDRADRCDEVGRRLRLLRELPVVAVTRGNSTCQRLSRSILDGARTGRIKAVDSRGKAIAGEGFYLLAIKKRGKLSHATGPSRPWFRGLTPTAWPRSTGFHRRSKIRFESCCGLATGTLQFGPRFRSASLPGETPVRLVRKTVLRGKVLGPDGMPMANIRVEAGGVGKDAQDEYDQDWTRTDEDGTYAIAVAPTTRTWSVSMTRAGPPAAWSTSSRDGRGRLMILPTCT